MGGVANSSSDDVGFGTGDPVGFDHFWNCFQGPIDLVGEGFGRNVKPDDAKEREPERFFIDGGPIAGDDAALFELVDPFGDRWSAQPDSFAQLSIRHPTVLEEEFQERKIDVIEVFHSSIL